MGRGTMVVAVAAHVLARLVARGVATADVRSDKSFGATSCRRTAMAPRSLSANRFLSEGKNGLGYLGAPHRRAVSRRDGGPVSTWGARTEVASVSLPATRGAAAVGLGRELAVQASELAAMFSRA